MRLGGGILGFLIFSILSTTQTTQTIIEFEPDYLLSDYVNTFTNSLIDHAGFRSLIEPEKVKSLTKSLTNGMSDLNKARTIHEFIREHVNYEPVFEHLSVNKVLEEQRGDCSEMAILSASMLESIGIKSYITNNQGHVFTIALIDNYWVIIDPLLDFNSQKNWRHNLPETHAYLINSTTTLISSASTTNVVA